MKSKGLYIRITEAEKESIKTAASKHKLNVTEWILKRCKDTQDLTPDEALGKVGYVNIPDNKPFPEVVIPEVRKCIHPKCGKWGEERVVHGMKAWLCSDHA